MQGPCIRLATGLQSCGKAVFEISGEIAIGIAGVGRRAAIRSMRSQGLGMDAIARELKIGKGVSQRVCQEYDSEQMEVS